MGDGPDVLTIFCCCIKIPETRQAVKKLIWLAALEAVKYKGMAWASSGGFCAALRHGGPQRLGIQRKPARVSSSSKGTSVTTGSHPVTSSDPNDFYPDTMEI